MTYSKAVIAGGVFTIPQSTEKLFLAQDGSLYRNRISYQSCRQYGAESSISFEDADASNATRAKPGVSPVLLATGTGLNLRLATKIDSEQDAAGDPIKARLAKAARDESGHSIPAGTVIRGHITVMQTVHGGSGGTVIGFRFDSMVLNGTALLVKLEPAFPDRMGNQVLHFSGRRAVLNAGFDSRWRFNGVISSPSAVQ
jgi:hypothetical protein